MKIVLFTSSVISYVIALAAFGLLAYNICKIIAAVFAAVFGFGRR